MSGTLHIIGVGPGDPELLTLKAVRLLGAAPVVAWFCKQGRQGHAHRIAAPHLRPDAERLAFAYPYTTELPHTDPCYVAAMQRCYAEAAARLAAHLQAGRDVALLCEGDPFLYGSAMYLFDHLAPAHPVEITPGITGMSGCWAEARLPMTEGDDILTVLPGTLDAPGLAARLAAGDAAVIMKVGRNLAKIRTALAEAGRAAGAVYVERGTMEDSRVLPLERLTEDRAPYFSMVLVPGRRKR